MGSWPMRLWPASWPKLERAPLALRWPSPHIHASMFRFSLRALGACRLVYYVPNACPSFFTPEYKSGGRRRRWIGLALSVASVPTLPLSLGGKEAGSYSL